MTYTKQAFSKARQKISPMAFVILNDEIVNHKYKNEGNYHTFCGYRLLAIDGTILELPNTKELQNVFGCGGNDKVKIARARASALYDVENKVFIDTKIGNCKVGERKYAQEHISRLKEIGSKNDLLLLDRGYASKDMMYLLHKAGVKYVMRMTTSSASEIISTKEDDEIVEIVVADEKLSVRVIKIILESGEEEILASNILDEGFTKKDFKEIYFKRWGIEVKYDEIKGPMQIENFTGETPIAIEQDFYATIYLSNMASFAADAANEEIKEQDKDKNLKYERKVNMNILIGKLKNDLVLMMLKWNPFKRMKIFNNIMKEISRNVVPIRPGRSSPRKKTNSRREKYPMNKRSAL